MLNIRVVDACHVDTSSNLCSLQSMHALTAMSVNKLNLEPGADKKGMDGCMP